MVPSIKTVLIFLGVTATTLGMASSGPVEITGRGTAQGRINCWTCYDNLLHTAQLEARRDANQQCGGQLPPALVGEFRITDAHIGPGQARITAEATFLCPQ